MRESGVRAGVREQPHAPCLRSDRLLGGFRFRCATKLTKFDSTARESGVRAGVREQPHTPRLRPDRLFV